MIVLLINFFLRMTLFLSTFVNRIDKKGRVSVPSTFRSSLEVNGFKGMVCYPSPNLSSIEGCTVGRIKKLSDAIDSLGPFSSERSTFSASILADSHQLNFDQEGRVIVPSQLINFAGINNEISFVGMGETFQMWNPEKYKKFKIETQKKAQDNLIKLKWNND